MIHPLAIGLDVALIAVVGRGIQSDDTPSTQNLVCESRTDQKHIQSTSRTWQDLQIKVVYTCTPLLLGSVGDLIICQSRSGGRVAQIHPSHKFVM